nr:nucleolin-like [Onthophagus taurus]
MQNKVDRKRKFGGEGKKNQTKGQKSPTESVAAQNDKKKMMKRKAPKENGDADGKKKKLAFGGTANLDGKKEGAEENGGKVMNSAQRKRLRNKQKRQMSRHSLGKIIGEMQKGDADRIQSVKNKIEAIKSRDTITNNARRKLRKLEGILRLCGIPVETSTGKKVSPKGKNQKTKNASQKSKKAAVTKEESDENDAEEEEDSDMEDSTANTSQEFLSLEGEDSEEDDDDEEDDEDDESEEEDDEEEKPTPTKQTSPNNKSQQKGKSRYVVFVGNLPYDIEKQQLMDHFEKVGEIHDIRIVTDPKTKKPKGFAYVEVKNEDSYQKALGLHNTFINGRKINVQYTQGGKKKGEDAKKEIKAKNMKLQAMRKEGKFGGKNPSQKRSQRRMKQGSK